MLMLIIEGCQCSLKKFEVKAGRRLQLILVCKSLFSLCVISDYDYELVYGLSKIPEATYSQLIIATLYFSQFDMVCCFNSGTRLRIVAQDYYDTHPYILY